MPSVSPALLRALEGSSYDGPRWSVERALDQAHRNSAEGEVAETLKALQRAAAPAPRAWYGQRLPVFWTMFMAARAADARALTVWMSETARLLGDLPHDIVGFAIDEAIKASRHGFLPSVGEIRGIADPLAAERKLQVERLAAMKAAMDDPVATAEREERRRVAALVAAQGGNFRP